MEKILPTILTQDKAIDALSLKVCVYTGDIAVHAMHVLSLLVSSGTRIALMRRFLQYTAEIAFCKDKTSHI